MFELIFLLKEMVVTEVSDTTYYKVYFKEET